MRPLSLPPLATGRNAMELFAGMILATLGLIVAKFIEFVND
jgi:hypothetical protein